MNYFKQCSQNLDNWIPPKSRELVLRNYFKKYLPSMSARSAESVEWFITWNISYGQMILIFRSIQFQQNIDKILKRHAFDRRESRIYGPRSMAPYPENLIFNSLTKEIALFQEVFWMRDITPSPNRVPWTQKVIRWRAFGTAW